ncbi:stage VI sporulation protein F [Bacillus suaedae]|uniref:Stage VI sporulation protein F n=1 Tax=Halalkalibacter suaedae TaxID=2822140 RepID=A0A941ANP6_9BACI|nr:stage VI sporulation protein F [Bacillus suaedae]MBP3950577.1 stage VI sporulation protein F [Bacillus suaedae]
MFGNSDFMDQISKKTSVRPDELLKLANSVSNANLQDEETVRQLIKDVAKLANKEVTKEKEDQIVEAIVKNDMPMDFASLAKMFNKK